MTIISSFLRIREFKLHNRHFKYFLLGITATVLCLNVILHSGSVLQYYCDDECLQNIIRYPPKLNDPIVLKHIQEYWLDSPSPKGQFNGNFDSENTPWAGIGRWGEANKFINEYFKYIESDKLTFIEVGAYDGEFMSFSLGLELELGYKGLLIEPNPFYYNELRKKNRFSYSINACVSPEGIHKQDKLWIRKNGKNLPDEMLRLIQGGANQLVRYVAPEEIKLGYTIPVQCFNLPSMVLATFGKLYTSLLIISTQGGELDILENISADLKIRVIVLVTRLNKDEMSYVQQLGKERGLVIFYSKSNTHILLPKDDVRTE